LLLAPNSVDIRAVIPLPIPDPIAMSKKNTGNDKDRAARASLDICPDTQVSTTLYIVLKKNPKEAGIASSLKSLGIGSVVRLFVEFDDVIGNIKF